MDSSTVISSGLPPAEKRKECEELCQTLSPVQTKCKDIWKSLPPCAESITTFLFLFSFGLDKGTQGFSCIENYEAAASVKFHAAPSSWPNWQVSSCKTLFSHRHRTLWISVICNCNCSIRTIFITIFKFLNVRQSLRTSKTFAKCILIHVIYKQIQQLCYLGWLLQ